MSYTEETLSAAMVADAEVHIRRYLSITPLRNYPLLDSQIGKHIKIWVKHENHHPTNNFKIRNVISALAAIPQPLLVQGVITASTGSHGLSLAWAAAQMKIRATICLPINTPAVKTEAMRAYGAQIVHAGHSYDDSLNHARTLAAKEDISLLEATNNLGVLAGAATMTREILGQKPDADAIVMSIGGGSHAAGAISVLRHEDNQHCAVFGVQAAFAPAIHNSWHAGQRMVIPARETIAEGLSTSTTYDMTFNTLLHGLAEFVTVTDAEIIEAIKHIILLTGNLVEGAGAVGLAGTYKLRDVLAGKSVVIVLTGANPSLAMLRKVFGEDWSESTAM